MTWLCGTDEDPRANIGPCIDCVKTVWDKALDALQDESNTLSYEQLRHLVDDQLVPELIVVQRDDIPIAPRKLKQFFNAQKTILGNYRDSVVDKDTPLTSPPVLTDEDSYDIVFAQVKTSDKTPQTPAQAATMREQRNKNAEAEFRPRQTPYGHGVRLTIVSLESIASCFSQGKEPSHEGEITICIGTTRLPHSQMTRQRQSSRLN